MRRFVLDGRHLALEDVHFGFIALVHAQAELGRDASEDGRDEVDEAMRRLRDAFAHVAEERA